MHLWGVLFVTFGIVDGPQEGKDVKINIWGSGRLFRPVDLVKGQVTCDPVYKIDYISQVHRTYVEAMERPIGYNENKEHTLGFTWYNMKTYFAGDLAHLHNYLGLQLNSTNMCLICECTQQQNRSMPAVNTRTWKTRDMGRTDLNQYYRNEMGMNKKRLGIKDLKAITDVPIYDIQPFFVALAVFHVKEGVTARILYPLIRKLNEGSVNKQEHDNIRNAMRIMMEKQEAYLTLYTMEQLSTRDNELQFDGLRDKVIRARFQYESQQMAVNQLINKRTTQKGRQFSAWLRKRNIREYYPISNSMQGSSANSFIEHWEEIAQFLQEKQYKSIRMYLKGLMIRYSFICQVMLTKNTAPFTDAVLEALKQAIIEFECLYKKYLKLILTPDTTAFGFKIHYLYHIWEWCVFFRFSPAWIDDQRCEAFNQRLKRYWMIFSCFMNEESLLKMINTMVRHTCSSIDSNTTSGMSSFKFTDRVTCDKDYYQKYRGNSRIETDERYNRLQSYEN
jgi:hypothetical protein